MTKIIQKAIYIAVMLHFCIPVTSSYAISRSSCLNEKTQQESNRCAGNKVKKLDTEMNKLYEQQMADPRQTNEAKAQFVNSQNAWVSYRDQACAYELGPREQGGSIWSMQMDECLAMMTKQRILILKHYASCTEDGCSQ